VRAPAPGLATEVQELPIFVLSGAYSQAIEDAWAAGATGVLSKSTDTPNKVVEVLGAALAA
jgi:hypothetical protein